MNDYIKREDAVERVAYELIYEAAIAKGLTYKEFIELEAKKQEGVKLQVRKWLEQVSSADVVEVVRCKDCIHNDQCKHRVVMWVEDPINTWHKDIDFCSYGERKEQKRNIFLDESID